MRTSCRTSPPTGHPSSKHNLVSENSPEIKKPAFRAALIKQHRNVFGKRRSFGYAVSPFCRSFSMAAGSSRRFAASSFFASAFCFTPIACLNCSSWLATQEITSRRCASTPCSKTTARIKCVDDLFLFQNTVNLCRTVTL